MIRLKGPIIRPNTKTRYCYIQRLHILWDPYCLQIVLTLNFMYLYMRFMYKCVGTHVYVCVHEYPFLFSSRYVEVVQSITDDQSYTKEHIGCYCTWE